VVVPSARPGAVLPEAESAASAIGHITLDEKPTGQPSAGNPHAGLDEAGAGNVAMGAGLRSTTKGVEKPPDPKVRAPALDPTSRCLPEQSKHPACKKRFPVTTCATPSPPTCWNPALTFATSRRSWATPAWRPRASTPAWLIPPDARSKALSSTAQHPGQRWS